MLGENWYVVDPLGQIQINEIALYEILENTLNDTGKNAKAEMRNEMAYIPCDWFYEHMLGDNCNNKCNECFGDKEVYICKEDFEVAGEMLNIITVEKGSWWSVVFMNCDHVLLDAFNGYQLSLKRDLFERYFENFVYSRNKE